MATAGRVADGMVMAGEPTGTLRATPRQRTCDAVRAACSLCSLLAEAVTRKTSRGALGCGSSVVCCGNPSAPTGASCTATIERPLMKLAESERATEPAAAAYIEVSMPVASRRSVAVARGTGSPGGNVRSSIAAICVNPLVKSSALSGATAPVVTGLETSATRVAAAAWTNFGDDPLHMMEAVALSMPRSECGTASDITVPRFTLDRTTFRSWRERVTLSVWVTKSKLVARRGSNVPSEDSTDSWVTVTCKSTRTLSRKALVMVTWRSSECAFALSPTGRYTRAVISDAGSVSGTATSS
mmetsp:Transcript_29236/g.67804  ORF Transcript_29236/g.67804 Transcript_29236/m.67804 type:complete len:299 (-) Transcript_29236:1900-2796(-)